MKIQRTRRDVRTAGALFLAACLALTAACGSKEPAPSVATEKQAGPDDGQDKGAVVLRLGESQYFRPDFEAYLRRIMGASPDKLTPEAQSRLFDRFVDDKLLLAAARRQGST